MNFYKVTYTIHTINPGGPRKRKVTEYMTAREGSAIEEACKYRFGQYLLSVEYKKIEEQSIKKGTSIYVAL